MNGMGMAITSASHLIMNGMGLATTMNGLGLATTSTSNSIIDGVVLATTSIHKLIMDGMR